MGFVGQHFLVCYITVSTCSQLITGHVSLTFPSARKYDLDFLDNVRTPGKCGMPNSDGANVTQIEQGSELTITWHLGYVHGGGYKLEILNANDSLAKDLTDGNFIGTDKTETQMHKVTLPPDFTCDKCTLRLQRQATEWGATYLFRSCADISIRKAGDVTDKCSGRGVMDAMTSKCTCESPYAGERCSSKDECRMDSDCGSNGKCLDIGGSAYPKKQCYCKTGWFGEKCSKKSMMSSFYDSRTYAKKELRSGVTLYYRLMKTIGQIEMILEANTESYVAIGWRPKGYKAQCRTWPKLKGFPVLDPGYSGETKCSKSGDPNAEPSKPEGEPESKPKPEGEPESTPKSEGEPVSEAFSEPMTEPTSEPTPESTAELTSEPTSEPTSESTSEPIAELSSEPTSEPKSEPISEPTSEPKSEPKAEPENSGEFHGMDCTDIVIGATRDMFHRIGDYYTRDRSTPRKDEVYGGKDDLQDANGFEKKGKTYVMFRKKLKASHRSDNDIECGNSHVIWAYGQTASAFYKKDELKYHSGNRGVTAINFHDMSSIGVKEMTIKQPFSLKLTSPEWDEAYLQSTSQKFKTLSMDITKTLMKSFEGKIDKNSKTKVKGFRRGSTIVDAEIETRGFAYEAEAFHQVTKTTLTQEIADGKLGSFTVDKTFLIHGFPVVEEDIKFTPEPEAEAEPLTWNETYILIGCVVICVVVIIVAIIVARVYVKRRLQSADVEKVKLSQQSNPGHSTADNSALFIANPAATSRSPVSYTNQAYQPHVPSPGNHPTSATYQAQLPPKYQPS